MSTVFLDTVGLVALWDRKDSWHAVATSSYNALDLKATRLVTSSFVLLECANHATHRSYRLEVVQLRNDLGISGDLYEPLIDELLQAWKDYSSGVFGTAGVIDIVSFAIMRRLGITRAFTNDAHFRAAGFETMF